METRYVKGQWNVICQRCGFKHKSGNIRKEWTGLMVCKSCWEPRHPQDFVTGRADKQAPPWSSPETTVSFRTTLLMDEDGNVLIDENGNAYRIFIEPVL